MPRIEELGFAYTKAEWKQRLRQDAFLEAYRETGSIAESCRRSGITEWAHYNWLKRSEDYARAFRIAGGQFATKMA